MRPRRSRAFSLLVTPVVLSGFLAPGLLAPTPAGAAPGPEPAAAPGPAAAPDLHELPVEPPAQPALPTGVPLFGSDCDIGIDGSRVTAYCHNPYPRTDLVTLHVECAQWWDVDGDTAPVAVGPAGRVELTGRCWKGVRSAWVGHRPG
ncbi:hypothetical protein LG634_25105 [Streptomyces bambusae]|uniref:hypothetical protein n=1 Tax=Streptomyces bambusae TaxID=1550616 RepID=UPI001CFD3381|nr:hypothetical protein [Streptomyces bambusae]MCB5168094.1 hypothetical protein [Streptomyces bambusae]